LQFIDRYNTTAPERHGHAQGSFAASQTATTAVAAAGAGALFGVAAWLPFVSAAACCIVIVVGVAACWRRVPGRVGRPMANDGTLVAGGT